MRISIIIPTYNEAQNIDEVLALLQANSRNEAIELIVVDGQSTDDTVAIAKNAGAEVYISPKKGRNHQMNYGADKATGDVLYFVHADSRPPLSYIKDILEGIANGYPIGCYRFRFNSDRKILRFNSWCTRFDKMFCRGGDQTLYVTRELFDEIGGYCPDHVIMEEYDFLIRARKIAKFLIIPKEVIVSARKYDDNSYLRVNFANSTVFMMFRFGYSPKRIHKIYRKLINHSN